MSEPGSLESDSTLSETVPESADEGRVPARGDLVGRYVVRGVVGRGGMGVVLEAFDPTLDRKVALKLLHAGASTDGQARLQREAQALARLAHPNVIRVHDVGTHEGRVFVAMELVQGRTLAQWLKAERPGWREALRVLTRAGEGLAAAHAAGLVHRDFKPSNVLLGDDGQVKVTDFGLARAHGEGAPAHAEGHGALEPASTTGERPGLDAAMLEATLTRTGAMVGTPAYMAPEQLRGEPVDPRSDQFAFCVTLYEALAGARPFGGGTPAAIAASIEAQRLAVPLPAMLPRRLGQAVRRGLQAEPGLRHPDLPSLLRALRHGRNARRRQASWVLAAAMVGGGTWWAMQTEPPPPSDDYCAAVAERLVGVWDDEQRDRARRAFEATKLSYADETWARVQERLDAQASAWVEAQREACEATARLDQGAAEGPANDEARAEHEALDRRMVCLHRRFAELRRLGALLTEADAALVERAPRALDALGSVESCVEVRAAPEPGGPSTMAQVEALAEVAVLQEAGRYDEAVRAAEAAVAASGEAPRSEQAEVLLGLADAEKAAGRVEEASRHFHEAFAAAVASGHDEMALRAALGLAAMEIKQAQPRFDEAERWTEHAQGALARLGPERSELVGRIESVRGQIDFQRGEYEAAREHFERALEVRSEELGADDYRMANHHNNLGHAYAALERQEDALEQQRRSLALERAHYGAEHPRVASALAQLCSSYSNAGQLDAAIATGTEAVAMLRRTVGQAHPSLGTALINLGSAQARAARFEEAERSFLDALANAEAAYGAQHRRVGLVLNNLGVHYELTGQLAEAERYHRRAVEVFMASLGQAHPTTAIVRSNLGSVLVKEGKLDEAEALLRDTLQTLEERLGSEHPDVALPLSLLGQVLMDRGRHAEALPMLERVHALWQPGRAPPEDVAATAFALGEALWQTKEDRARAIELVTRAHGLYRQLGEARAGKVEATRAWLRDKGVAVD